MKSCSKWLVCVAGCNHGSINNNLTLSIQQQGNLFSSGVVIESIVTGINEICGCNLTTKEIPHGVFICNSDTHITFRSQFNSKSGLTSTRFGEYLEEWISRNGTVIINTTPLSVTKPMQRPVLLSSLSDPYCDRPRQDPIVVSLAVTISIVLLIIIILVIIVVVSCYWTIHKSQR